MNLIGNKVVLGYSGGPDAAALAYKLKRLGAEIIPVYINYRKVSGGGKTTKDLRAGEHSAQLLKLPNILKVRAPLGTKPKSWRNRFFVSVLASVAREQCAHIVALGTFKKSVNERRMIGRATYNDLDPSVLTSHGHKHGVQVITWDTFGVKEKADEFVEMDISAQRAIFKTTSCQLWWKVECGNCASCVARHEAFLKAFGSDPTSYRPQSKVMRA